MKQITYNPWYKYSNVTKMSNHKPLEWNNDDISEIHDNNERQ